MEGVPLDAEMGVSEEPVTKQPKITIGSMYFNCFCLFDLRLLLVNRLRSRPEPAARSHSNICNSQTCKQLFSRSNNYLDSQLITNYSVPNG